MKIKMKKKCRDKYTGMLYKKGAVVEVSEERGNEMLAKAGFAEVVTDKDKDKKSDTVPDAVPATDKTDKDKDKKSDTVPDAVPATDKTDKDKAK
ncbi:MAG: hypothetical protein ACRCUS_08985 [Anaerovoracaceae bacterium]